MGAYLRAARTEKRVSLERAAEETKIKADFLMRMESDEFDFIAPAYARGFLRSYARFLGVEEEPLLEEFDRRFGTGMIESAQIVAADRSREKKRGAREHRSMSFGTVFVVLAAGVLLLLALIGIFAPRPARDRDRPAAAETPTVERTRTPKRDESPKPQRSPTPDAAELLGLEDGIDLQIETTEAECWVDIDADGEDLFAGVLGIGEVETFSAEDEMEVVLGAPSNVELTLNGEDLGTPVTDTAGALKFTLPDDLGSVILIPEDIGDPADDLVTDTEVE